MQYVTFDFLLLFRHFATFALLTGTMIGFAAGIRAASPNPQSVNDFVLRLDLAETEQNGFPGRRIVERFNGIPNNSALLGYAAPSANGIENTRKLFRLFTFVRFNDRPTINFVSTADADEASQLLQQGWRFGGYSGVVIAADDRREFTNVLFRVRSVNTFERFDGTSVHAYTYVSGVDVSARDNFLANNPEWEADQTVGRVSPINFPEELRTRGVGREVINLQATGFQTYNCGQPSAPFVGPLADLRNNRRGLLGSHFNRQALDLRGAVSGQVNIDLGGLDPNVFAGGPWWLLLDAERSAVRGQTAVRAPSLAANSIGRLLLDIVETRGNGFGGARFIVRDNLTGGLRPTVCPNQNTFYSTYTAIYRYNLGQ